MDCKVVIIIYFLADKYSVNFYIYVLSFNIATNSEPKFLTDMLTCLGEGTMLDILYICEKKKYIYVFFVVFFLTRKVVVLMH